MRDAAATLHVGLTDYTVAVQRAEAAVRKMDAQLRQAKETGAMKTFNQGYATMRAKAKREGRRIPAYSVCLDRLKAELFKCAAGSIDSGLIARALGEKEPAC